MTKAEELKLLEQIAELIKSAGEDSYICMTFDGITDVCRSNIENDFGNQPVRDLADERMMRVAVEREAEMAKKNVDSLQKMCDECLSEVEELRKRNGALELDCKGMEKRITELTDERDAMTDSAEGLREILEKSEEEATNASRMNNEYKEIVAEKDMEILRLKAEIYDLRNGVWN